MNLSSLLGKQLPFAAAVVITWLVCLLLAYIVGWLALVLTAVRISLCCCWSLVGWLVHWIVLVSHVHGVGKHPTNQPTNKQVGWAGTLVKVSHLYNSQQPINQPTNQPKSSPTDEPTTIELTHQQANQATNQPTSEGTTRSWPINFRCGTRWLVVKISCDAAQSSSLFQPHSHPSSQLANQPALTIVVRLIGGLRFIESFLG
jgi:hypothetical protein